MVNTLFSRLTSVWGAIVLLPNFLCCVSWIKRYCVWWWKGWNDNAIWAWKRQPKDRGELLELDQLKGIISQLSLT